MALRYALDLAAARAKPWAYAGFDEALGGWLIPFSLHELHDHLRCPITQPGLFDIAVTETAKIYDWAIGMPNLGKHRLFLPQRSLRYRDRVLDLALPTNPNFQLETPFFIEPGMHPDLVEEGYHLGAWRMGKGYPKNGTTESEWGIDFRYIESIFPILERMEKLRMWLLLHSEMVLDSVGELIADRLREPLSIAVVDRILRTFPGLRVTIEHLSKKPMVEAVRLWQAEDRLVDATIAPQYAIWNSTALFAGGMNPVNFSIPILGDEEDRLALIAFLMDGLGMAGKDNAIHDITAKSRPRGCSGGVFSGPVGLYVYFHLFRLHGGPSWFEKFLDFQCRRPIVWYELDPTPRSHTIIREQDWYVPGLYQSQGAQAIPLFADSVMPYNSERLPLAA